MTQSTMIVIVVAVVVLAAIGWMVWQRQRSEALRARYGPEYDRAVNQMGETTLRFVNYRRPEHPGPKNGASRR